MINTLEKLNENYNSKYNYLKLLSVVFDENSLLTTITFLYPYQIEEITKEDRGEIYNFFKELLSLKGELKLKYKRSFLDSRLIIDEVIEYFKNNKKGIFPYINIDNISSSYEGLDVVVSLNLNQDILSMLDEVELANSLKAHLEKNFIANIKIDIKENEETLPEEIDFIDPPAQKIAKTKRYEVKIEKKIIGGDILPKPEYISEIKSPKSSVILAGVITNKNRKTFIQKKGKNAGKEKSLYTFILKDKEAGSIECVYFCSKTHEKDMEALDDLFMILCLGDVKHGINGKLTYYIQKISIATPVELINQTYSEQEETKFIHNKVVFPETLTRKQQANLFEVKARYNDFIMKNDIVVFDIETTGLDPENCEITELGAVKIEKGEITEKFSSFAKPKFPIPEEVQRLTNITDDMVRYAPRIEDVVYDFYEWSRGCVISGYNIIGFDMKFINKVAKQIDLNFDNEVIDAYIVARQSSLRTTNFKLGTVVKALGLTLNDAHRAYNDAYATAQVLMELNKAK